MKYVVFGAGLMGKAAAYDLLEQIDTDEVIITDINRKNLAEVKAFLNSDKLRTLRINIADTTKVTRLLSDADAAIAAVH